MSSMSHFTIKDWVHRNGDATEPTPLTSTPPTPQVDYGLAKPAEGYQIKPQVSNLVGGRPIRQQGRKQNAFGVASLRQGQQQKAHAAHHSPTAVPKDKLDEAATALVGLTLQDEAIPKKSGNAGLPSKLIMVGMSNQQPRPRESVLSRLGVARGRVTKRGPDGVPSGVVNCIGRGRMGLRRNSEGDSNLTLSHGRRPRTRNGSGGRNNGRVATLEELDAEMDRYNAERRAMAAKALDAKLDSYVGNNKPPGALTIPSDSDEVEMTNMSDIDY